MQMTIRIVATAIGSEIFRTVIMMLPSPVGALVGHVVVLWETGVLATLAAVTDE